MHSVDIGYLQSNERVSIAITRARMVLWIAVSEVDRDLINNPTILLQTYKR